MAAPAPRPRDLADRARLQPAGRRPARRLRPAAGVALLALIAGCGGAPAKEAAPARAQEFRARFREQRWDGASWDGPALVAGLRAYIAGDDPIYPRDDPRCRALHEYLYAQRPDPAELAPLLGPRGAAADVDGSLLKRDLVAICVTTSYMRRIAEDPSDPYRAALYDALAGAWVQFGFDPLYQASHTGTSEEVTDFLSGASFPPCPESRAAVRRVLEEEILRWRGRVSTKASSTFFGIVMRHLGREGTDRLFAEWGEMRPEERYDLLRRVADRERPGPAACGTLVEETLDPDPDLRQAAFDALRALGAPLGGVDSSSREDERRAAGGRLRQWAAKTES